MAVLVVKRCVALRLRLELVKEVTDQLTERQVILKVDHFSITHELFALAIASAALTQFLDFSAELARRDYCG